MSKSTTQLPTCELFATFTHEATARSYLEGRRWPDGARCPVCDRGERVTARKDAGYYRCNRCMEDFTVRTGTIFERSHVPLHLWLYAARKGGPSLPLSRELGVTQKSAWFMLRRLRDACGDAMIQRRVVVEKSPAEVDALVDRVFAFRPAPKSAAARRRKHRAAKIEKGRRFKTRMCGARRWTI